MHELDVENFTRYVVRQIETLGNVILSNPDNTEEFPLCVVSNPMQSIRKTEESNPIYSRFSITAEWWTNSKYESMNLFQQTNVLLRESNIWTVGTPFEMYDEITKKYRYGSRYEVNYNGLTNSFEKII